MRYVCLLLFWSLNCTYRFFVMSCLYSTVSLIQVREWQFIRIVYYYYYYLCSYHIHRTYLGLLMLELLGVYVCICIIGYYLQPSHLLIIQRQNTSHQSTSKKWIPVSRHTIQFKKDWKKMSVHKEPNQHLKDVIQTQQQRPELLLQYKVHFVNSVLSTRYPRCKTNKLKNYFVPLAIFLLSIVCPAVWSYVYEHACICVINWWCRWTDESVILLWCHICDVIIYVCIMY